MLSACRGVLVGRTCIIALTLLALHNTHTLVDATAQDTRRTESIASRRFLGKWCGRESGPAIMLSLYLCPCHVIGRFLGKWCGRESGPAVMLSRYLCPCHVIDNIHAATHSVVFSYAVRTGSWLCPRCRGEETSFKIQSGREVGCSTQTWSRSGHGGNEAGMSTGGRVWDGHCMCRQRLSLPVGRYVYCTTLSAWCSNWRLFLLYDNHDCL